MNDLALSEVPEPKLTKKQRAFLKLYFETGNGVQSAMKVYDTDNYFTAGSIASENLKKLKNPIKQFMEANGFSLKVLLAVLADGLQAKKLEDLSGEKVPDHNVRHKYLETASKWLGVDKTETEPDNLKKRIIAEEFFQ